MERLKSKGKGHIGLYLFLLVVAVGVMLSVRNCGSQTDNTVTPPAGDTIAVAVQYAPPAFYMDHDTLRGIDYELLQMLGMPVKIYPVTTPAEGLDGLERGIYSVVVADIPRQTSGDDDDEYLYTTPAYLDRQVLVQIKDNEDAKPRISSVLDLIGDTVYVTQGSPMAQRMANISREVGGDIHVVEVPSSSEMLLLHQAMGDYPLTVVNEQVVKALAGDYPSMDYSVQISFTQFQPWILRDDEHKLCAEIDTRLDSIKATPTYKQLLQRYAIE